MNWSRVELIRLFNDAEGESHFEDLVLRSTPGSTGGGNVSRLVETIGVTAMELREVEVEAVDQARHCAPRRQFVFLLSGAAEIEASDGERRRVGPGDVLFVEDTEGRGHRFTGFGPARRTLILPVPPAFVLPVVDRQRSDDAAR